LLNIKKNMKYRYVLIALTLLSFATTVIHAQTTAFNYQGRLTDGGNPANGNFQMQFKLFDALAAGTQIGSTLTDVPVTATNGTFSTKLDFGSAALTGANRWLEIAVRRNSGESYVTLSPREQIASSPYAVRTLSAAMADDSQKLGGVAASEYVTNTSAGTSFIRNQATQQPSSNFNISNNGIIGGNLGLGTNATAAKFSILTTTASAGNNTAQFEAPAIGPNGSHIHYGTTGDWYIRSANAGGKVILQDSGGNVGIGTPNPTSKLTVSGIQYGISHIDGTVNLSTFINASGGWFGTRSNHPLHFFTNDSAQQMTLNQAGQLGVGTTAPLAGYRGDFAGPVRSFGDTSHVVVQTIGGTNSWARFYMRSNNRSWFIGTSQNFNGDQFYLADETAGQTRFSIQPNGGRISFFGNVGQDTGSGGLVKAMIFVNANGTIGRCYNGNTGSTTGGCGFTVSHPQADLYEVNFGFDVSTRFLSMTSSSIWLPGVQAIVGRVAPGSTVNGVRAIFWRSGDQTAQPSDFFLVVY
jgi:hypothetical protein